MFRHEKLASEVFPIEACQSLAKWFLDQLINKMPVINAGGLNEQSWGVSKLITQEQKQEFVDKYSQSFFEQMKKLKIFPGITRALPIHISSVASYAKEAGFPDICLPKQLLLKPVAWLMPDGLIAADDGFENKYIYDCKKFEPYRSFHYDETLVPAKVSSVATNNKPL